MDAQLSGETGTPPTWDFALTLGANGADSVPIITGALEAQQQAEVACYLILGSVKQIPAAGVDHLGFLGGEVNFGQLDAQIRQFLLNVGRNDFYPDYDIINHGLSVVPRKVTVTP